MKNKKIPFYANIDDVHLPFIRINIDAQRSIVMLVDTGSEYNQVFEYLYNETPELFTDTGEHINIQGIGGDIEVPLMSGNLYVNSKEYTTTFVVTDSNTGHALSDTIGFPVGGLIGTRFLAEYGWIIDYSKQVIYYHE